MKAKRKIDSLLVMYEFAQGHISYQECQELLEEVQGRPVKYHTAQAYQEAWDTIDRLRSDKEKRLRQLAQPELVGDSGSTADDNTNGHA